MTVLTDDQKDRYAQVLHEQRPCVTNRDHLWDEDDAIQDVFVDAAEAVALAARADLIAEMIESFIATGESFLSMDEIVNRLEHYVPSDPDTSDAGGE